MNILLSFIGLLTFCSVHSATVNPVHKCSALHNLDLSKFETNGTEYSAGGCALKCMIDGKLVSSSSVNEGSACNAVPNGVCHNGVCVQHNETATVLFDPFEYTFSELNVTTQHAVLHDRALNMSKLLYVTYQLTTYHNAVKDVECETKSYITQSNISSHSHVSQYCQFSQVTENSIIRFSLHDDDDDGRVRVIEIPIMFTFRQYLLAHPNSVTNGIVQFVHGLQLKDKSSIVLADLYVQLKFLNVKKVE